MKSRFRGILLAVVVAALMLLPAATALADGVIGGG